MIWRPAVVYVCHAPRDSPPSNTRLQAPFPLPALFCWAIPPPPSSPRPSWAGPSPLTGHPVGLSLFRLPAQANQEEPLPCQLVTCCKWQDAVIRQTAIARGLPVPLLAEFQPLHANPLYEGTVVQSLDSADLMVSHGLCVCTSLCGWVRFVANTLGRTVPLWSTMKNERFLSVARSEGPSINDTLSRHG